MASPRQKRQRLALLSPDASDASPHAFALAPASQRALAIPEILEAVLSHTQADADVQRLRMVCSTWHDVLMPRVLRCIRGFVDSGWITDRGCIRINLDTNSHYAQHIQAVAGCGIIGRASAPMINVDWLYLCRSLIALEYLTGQQLVDIVRTMHERIDQCEEESSVLPNLKHLEMLADESLDREALSTTTKTLPKLESVDLVTFLDTCKWTRYRTAVSVVLNSMGHTLRRLYLHLKTSYDYGATLPDLPALARLIGNLPRLEYLSIDSWHDLSQLWDNFIMPPSLRALDCCTSPIDLRCLFRAISESPAFGSVVHHLSLSPYWSPGRTAQQILDDTALVRQAIEEHARRTGERICEGRMRNWASALRVSLK